MANTEKVERRIAEYHEALAADNVAKADLRLTQAEGAARKDPEWLARVKDLREELKIIKAQRKGASGDSGKAARKAGAKEARDYVVNHKKLAGHGNVYLFEDRLVRLDGKHSEMQPLDGVRARVQHSGGVSVDASQLPSMQLIIEGPGFFWNVLGFTEPERFATKVNATVNATESRHAW